MRNPVDHGMAMFHGPSLNPSPAPAQLSPPINPLPMPLVRPIGTRY